MRPSFFLLATIVTMMIMVGPLLAQDGGLGPVVPDCEGDNCKFADFLQLLDNIFQAILWLAVPAASIAIAYAGIVLATAQDDTGKRNEAKAILWSAVLGLVIVLAAWLIVNTVLEFLATDQFQLKNN